MPPLSAGFIPVPTALFLSSSFSIVAQCSVTWFPSFTFQVLSCWAPSTGVQTACFSRLLVSSSQPASAQCLSIALTCTSQLCAEMLHRGKNPISSSYIASDLLLSPALYNISISTCSYSLVSLNVPLHHVFSHLTISTA